MQRVAGTPYTQQMEIVSLVEMYLVASPTPVERKHDAAFNLELMAPSAVV